jgi:Retrotransposon gag protein
MSSFANESANEGATRVMTREELPHLSDLEWDALGRMAEAIGGPGVAALLHSLSHDEQHATVAQFISNELKASQAELSELAQRIARQEEDARQRVAALTNQVAQQLQLLESQQRAAAATANTARTWRGETLKVDVSKYKGLEGESLLRWFVELEDAMAARRIDDESMRVTFAMSNLGGRAKAWALGLKLRDVHCFPSYASFKHQLRESFEPPKSEFRARTEFLDLKQGKRDIHAYAQQARYLVSCIVTDPVDDQTQVVTYIKGLVDGPIKTHLFREYPSTLEKAIQLSLQEDFSLKQAYVHSASYRPTRKDELGGEPMDLSVADSSSPNNPSGKSKATSTCNRCKKVGHFAYECLAPRPTTRSVGQDRRDGGRHVGGNRSRATGGQPQRRDRPKNGRGQ